MDLRYSSIVIIFIVVVSVMGSGCSSSSQEEAVSDMVMTFLNAINDGDFNTAFNLYQGKDFLAVASVEMIFSNKGIDPGSIKQIEITALNVSGNLAVVTADCSVSSVDMMGNEREGTSSIPVYFRLQDSDLGWIITRVAFNEPLTLEGADLVDIEVASTPIDVIANNAPIIFVLAIAMLGSGLYLDKKDKAKKKENSRTVDTSGATPIQKESIAQYVRFVPAQDITVGKLTSVDVWVKNFTQQPYENFSMKAKFGTALDAEKVNLFFDTVAPGETVKRTWVVKPKVAGWASIEEPTVVFDYMGTKYIGVLDPVWLQVQ
ncbi:hypothetical protein [Methanolobus profundi]|uniref:Uncharacterized protein n=1 Tax=Methanolobus profundi TaxID=487685 RepID=A0A1I4Q1U9_9EURY|nr:hypothetical protein [Methanolobus profundi]SFM34027.1 hypothetical protein SAMN04488696_1046 [Methanolobus profundi]